MLFVAVIAYTGFWLYAAGRIKTAFAVLAASPGPGVTVSWKSIGTSGYPFGFRIELTDLRLAGGTAIEATAQRLFATASIGDFDNWRFSLPDGFDAKMAEGAARTLSARWAGGAVSLRPDGGVTVWFNLGKSRAQTGIAGLDQVTFGDALTWLIVPGQPPKTATDKFLSVALNLHDVRVPTPPAPFGHTIDDLALGIAVLGPVPDAPFDTALARWSKGGGSIRLESSELAWDRLDVTGKGHIALDTDLQPNGSLAIEVAGYDQLLTALSVAGLVPQSNLSPMKLGLAMLGSAISTDFTVKDGDMFLGPANLGKAPQIDWK